MSDRRRSREAEAVTEMDVLAYADGLLERDPERRREVAAYLEAHPEAAARVADYRAQDELIRRRYAPLLARPAPERLSAVLERPGSPPWQGIARAAAVAALMGLAAVSGWLLAERRSETPPWVEAFLDTALERSVPASAGAGAQLAPAPPAPPHADPAGRLAPLDLHVPDLSEAGYRVRDKQIFDANGSETVQIRYAAADGHEVGLFVRPRWREEQTEIRFARRGDLTLAHWAEGPVVYALAARASEESLAALANSIRRGLHRGRGDATTAVAGGLDAPAPGRTEASEKPVLAPSPRESSLTDSGPPSEL